MKRILIILLLCVGSFIHAQEYQITEVEEIAYSFFNASQQYAPGVDGSHSAKQISSIDSISRDNVNYMYIANAEDSAGWVIISNEKRYTHIIAYSDTGSFAYNDEELPPALICILNNHMNIIDSIRNNRVSIAKYSVETSANTPISPTYLSAVKWAQDQNRDGDNADCNKIYNKFCPKINQDSCKTSDGTMESTCNRKLAGCGAVAMAQLMKYWQWPDYAMVDNNIYYYDWDNMPDEIANNTDMYLVDQVARLIENCRTAAQSFGNCQKTGAEISKIHDAMVNIFGYHSNLVRPKQEKVYIPTMLVNEIHKGRPVIVQAFGDTLTKEAHTFIIDGYRIIDSNNDGVIDTTYHVNFGWRGYKNTYYSLAFDGYYRWQTYLIELYPDCSFRADNVSLSNTLTIDSLNNRTFYSANNVTLCSNNNSITVNSGGHLLVKAGNEVRINSGFHAEVGSDVKIMINDTLCNSAQETSTPQRIAPKTSSSNDSETYGISTYNSIENLETENIVSTSIYTISGQLIQTITGGQLDTSHLPKGMYILHHCMSDGNIRSEKIANY